MTAAAAEYIVGQRILIKDTITNPDTGALVDDASDAVTVYAPDGSSSTPSVTHVSLGVYTAQFAAALPGWHEYVWLSAGAGAGAARGTFYVAPTP